MKHPLESHLNIEVSNLHADLEDSNVTVTDEAKVTVILSLLEIFHKNVAEWTTRCFTASTWALSIHYGVVSYFYITPNLTSMPATAIVAIGLLAIGIIHYFYLRAAARAHFGNRLGIAKCEAALALYRSGVYLNKQAFFAFSKTMLHSHSLKILILFHMAGSIGAIVLICLLRFLK